MFIRVLEKNVAKCDVIRKKAPVDSGHSRDNNYLYVPTFDNGRLEVYTDVAVRIATVVWYAVK